MYFLRLMADGRKLERSLPERPVRFGKTVQADEEPLVELSSELYS
jgi:hypothetical protein